MVTIIESRRSIWRTRFFMPFFFIAVAIFYLCKPSMFAGTNVVVVGMLSGAVGLWSLITLIVEIIFVPKGAVLDSDDKTIEAKYFFSSKLIPLDEIVSMTTNSMVKGKRDEFRYDGVMLYLKTGQKYFLVSITWPTMLIFITF